MASRSRSRRSAAPGTAPAAADGASPCPCGLPAAYADCCGRFHAGGADPATAELLMRSRYSAFAVRDTSYLLRTWAAATRPARLDLDPAARWTGLEILETTGGTAFHTSGTVTFRARCVRGPGAGRGGGVEVQHECSRFVREQGRWVYVDGDVDA
ncbi:YchJ family protein [Streptomyces fuscigenes]|uniref:YchJ family protein n=1 Tax=Streptomyces fuscigenes TaxID=1528880 RepID=UPI001F31C958|nr:YchJ family metal-binding protein [Streptomyces fuscigenes]MCF3962297.1 hypothetical protein [Streptomyces fuscigenes]